MFKKYRLGFDIWGLIIFFIIMIPNFIWFMAPAPNDILRQESVTVLPDMIASVCQVLMIITLSFIIKKDRKSIHTTLLFAVLIALIGMYYICWLFYYWGTVNTAVVLGLALFPCLAFLIFAAERENIIAVIPITIFTVCHLIYAIVNFIV